MEQQLLEVLIDRVSAMDRKYDEKLDKILTQTTKTNGRVNSLENDCENLKSDVGNLKTISSETKGRDKVLYLILMCIGAIIGFFIQSKV